MNTIGLVKRSLLFALGAILAVPICSCGYSSPNSSRPSAGGLPISATVTVTCKRNDHLGFREELEHRLVNRGYNVVSEDVARKAIVSEFGAVYRPGAVAGRVETFGEKQLRSVYALSFTYTTYLDGQMKTLQGSLIDLRTGRILRSMKVKRFGWAFFNGYDSYLDEFVNQI